MEVSYRRDLNKNYMCVEAEKVTGKEYPIRMLEQNEIAELLPFQARRMNGKLYFYYEITSRQPLKQIYETAVIKSREMEQLLSGILRGMEHAQQYLLSEQDFLLDPEYLYFNAETGKVFLCCIPFSGESGNESFLLLAEFILKKLDHGDRRAVELGYALFNRAAQECFGFQENLRLLLKEYSESADEKERNREKPEVSQDILMLEEMMEEWPEDFPEKKENRDKERTEKRSLKEEIIKKRKPKENKQKDSKRKAGSWKVIGTWIVCLMAMILLFTGIVYFGRLDLTQTGGLAFLFLALLWIIYSIKESRQEKKKKKHWLEEEDTELEEWEETLLSELYENSKEDSEKIFKEDSEDICGETRCLTGLETDAGLRLVSMQRREAPDIVIDREKVIIGKKRDQVTVCLHQEGISRIHARVEKKNEQYFITDLNSTNGTFINGERLLPNEQRKIVSGDKINLAMLRFVVKET